MSEMGQQKSVSPSSKIGTTSSKGSEGTAGPNFPLAPQTSPASDVIADNATAQSLYLDSSQGSEHRVDQPHAADQPLIDESIQPAGETNLQQAESSPSPESVDEQSPAPRALPRISRGQRELLLQASQIAEQLQDQFQELDRRERNLNEQLSALDQERRSVRLRIQEFEDEMLNREDAVRAQQAEFAGKFATCEKLVADLEQQQQDFDQARRELDDERSRLREELGHDLDIERAALRQAQGAVETERQQQRQQLIDHRRECDLTLEREQQALTQERELLRENIAAELVRERAEFERERDDWALKHATELSQLRHERGINESAITRAQEELLFIKREQEADVERRTHELEANLDQIRIDFDREQEERQAEYDAHREAEMIEVNRERDLIEQAVLGSEKELQLQKQRHEQQLRAEREELQREFETRRGQLKQQQALFENRMRFQQEHLQKVGLELETLQHELQVNQQQAVTELEQRETLQRLQANQLNHFRILLDEREQSLEREQQWLSQWQRTLANDARSDKASLRQEQDSCEQERKAQQAEIQRQQDLLTLHAENLEARRNRLDHLRSELEETHRRTLEMRIAIEEAWAQLSQAAGTDTARERVDQASEDLSEHYRHLGDAISQQRQELLEAQGLFERQKDEFRGERHKLTEWIAERETKVRKWEEQLRQESKTLDSQYTGWRSTRDGWLQEKVAAEGVIRNLLSQLTVLNGSDNTGSDNTAGAEASVAATDRTTNPDAITDSNDDFGGKQLQPAIESNEIDLSGKPAEDISDPRD